MTEEQRRHLEQRLIEERDRIQRSLERNTAATGADEDDSDLSHYPYHLADQGSDTNQQELSASLATRETQELEEINEALRRLYEEPDRFGRDEETGEAIPFERLDMIPWARRARRADR